MPGRRCRRHPPELRSGEAYQFDWSHDAIEMAGLPMIVKVAHMRLSFSRMPFVRAYPRETQEMCSTPRQGLRLLRRGLPARHLRQHEDRGRRHLRRRARVFNRHSCRCARIMPRDNQDESLYCQIMLKKGKCSRTLSALSVASPENAPSKLFGLVWGRTSARALKMCRPNPCRWTWHT